MSPIRQWFDALYPRLITVNQMVFGVIATIVYSLVYIAIVPFIAIGFRKKVLNQSMSGWHMWTLRADTLEDVKKQY